MAFLYFDICKYQIKKSHQNVREDSAQLSSSVCDLTSPVIKFIHVLLTVSVLIFTNLDVKHIPQGRRGGEGRLDRETDNNLQGSLLETIAADVRASLFM